MSHLDHQTELINNISNMISNQKEKLDEMFADFIKKMTIEINYSLDTIVKDQLPF